MNLHKALKLCLPALGNPIIKGLDSFHFKGNTVSAFNGSMLIKTDLDFEFPIEGSIPGDTFYKLINELGENIELDKTDSSLIVKSGKSKTHFPVESIDISFLLEDAEEGHGITYLPTDLLFAAGLKRCITTVGGKGIPQLEVGVHIYVDTPTSNNIDYKSECFMYSSNGTRFSRYVFPLDTEHPLGQIFLPASFCEQLITLYSEMDKVPNEVAVTQQYIRAKFDNVILRHSFYANPVSWEMRGQVDQAIENVNMVDLPEGLSNAIKRSEIIAGNSPITFEFDDTKLYLSAKGLKNQQLSEELDMPYPISGSLDLDLKNLRKIIESCKEIGFGDDYVVLGGSEDYYDLILTAKSINRE